MSSSPTPLRADSEDPDDQRIRQVVDAYLRLHAPIPGYDADDLYQEGRISWLRAKHTYRTDGGAARSTYIGSVVQNRLVDLSRATQAARRWSPRGTLSLDATIRGDGDPLADLLPDNRPTPDEEAERREIAERLARVRSRLPRRQRDVLDALGEDRPRTALARDLGVARDTVYADIAAIQRACRDAGLDDFLR